MKRFNKSMLGVTLLEIMLVLAIAAMVIVMSIRYYQAANASQQANSTLEMIQAITAAADGLAQGTNSYSSVSTSSVTKLMPNGIMTAPWGGAITISSPSSTGYTVGIVNMPAQVCDQLSSRLKASNNYTAITPTDCGTSTVATFSYTYTNSPAT